VRVGPSVLRLGTDLLRGERRGLHRLAGWKHLLARQHGCLQLCRGAAGSAASGEGTRGRSATREMGKFQVVDQGRHGGTRGTQRLRMSVDKVRVPALHPPTAREPASGSVGPRAGTPTPGGTLRGGKARGGPPTLVVSPGGNATPRAMQGAQGSCDTHWDRCPGAFPPPSSPGSHLLLQALQHGR